MGIGGAEEGSNTPSMGILSVVESILYVINNYMTSGTNVFRGVRLCGLGTESLEHVGHPVGIAMQTCMQCCVVNYSIYEG